MMSPRSHLLKAKKPLASPALSPIDSAREKEPSTASRSFTVSSNRTDRIKISRRYATAIFALASEAKKQADIVGELGVLAAAIRGNKALGEALSSPLVSLTEKQKLLAALVKKGEALTKRAVDTIAKGGRADLIPTIVDTLHHMLAEQQGVLGPGGAVGLVCLAYQKAKPSRAMPHWSLSPAVNRQSLI